MSGGILRYPWTSQPQILTPLNPVYRAIGAYTPITNAALNQAKKYPALVAINAPTVSAGPAGLQWNFNGSSQYFSANLGAEQLEGFTIIAIGTPTNVAGNSAIVTIANTTLSQGSYGIRINAGVVGAYAYSSAGALNESVHAVSAVNNKTYVFGAVFASDARRTVYLNGTPGTPNTTSGAVTSASQFSIGVLNRSGITQYWPGGVNGVFVLPWALTDAEMARMKTPADVYAAMYAPIQRTIWVPAAAGGGTHTTTGALSASAATIAGTATHLTLHTTSGALAASDATIAGSANRSTTHPTSGVLVASDAVIAGAATHLTLHTSSGSLVAGDAALAGAADHSAPGAHTTSGALAADVAVIAGSATHLALHTSTGALVADSASIAGTALHTPIHAASGGLVASEGALLGIALRTPAPTAHDATGGLVAGAAEIAGLATGPALPFFSVSGGGIKPKHHKKPTPSLFDEELKAPTAKLKKAVVPSFTPSTFVPYAKMGVPKALSKALGEVLVGPLSAPLREVLPPEYDDDDIPDEVIMLALQ